MHDLQFISYPNEQPETLAKIYGGLWEMYARPYTKWGPFIIGLLLGCAIAKINTRISVAKSRALFLSFSLLAVLTVYGILPEYWSPGQGNTLYNTLYTALFRTVFAAAIATMIAAIVFRKNK